MTQIDENALDVAVESLRPLFREPVTYLEQAARDSIAAYLAALPPGRDVALPPAVDVGEIAKNLRLISDDYVDVSFIGKTTKKAAAVLESLSARLAEAEWERDENDLQILVEMTPEQREAYNRQIDASIKAILEKNGIKPDELQLFFAGRGDKFKYIRNENLTQSQRDSIKVLKINTAQVFGFMDCKIALIESNWDQDKATEWLATEWLAALWLRRRGKDVII